MESQLVKLKYRIAAIRLRRGKTYKKKMQINKDVIIYTKKACDEDRIRNIRKYTKNMAKKLIAGYEKEVVIHTAKCLQQMTIPQHTWLRTLETF